MKIFSKIINEETKELDCIVCGDTPLEGYSELEREQAYNGKFYLKGYAPEESPEERQQRLDKLMLTPSDVERALYYSKLQIDFDDLKVLISEKAPQIDMKGLAIEFRANNFYRGAVDKNGNRIVDMVGALLGYTPEDMNYLFEHKELPSEVEE